MGKPIAKSKVQSVKFASVIMKNTVSQIGPTNTMNTMNSANKNILNNKFIISPPFK